MIRPSAFAACAVFAALAAPAHATDIPLATAGAQAGYGAWQTFNVSEIDSRSFGLEWIDAANTNDPGFGSPLAFTFTIDAGAIGTFTVVDAGFAGDTFAITNFGSAFGATSAVPSTVYASSTLSVGDFDAALADLSFSRGVFTLGAGSYRISGRLDQSVRFDDGTPLNATFGGVRLTVSAVPEPASIAMLLAGFGLIGLLNRRRL